VSDRGFEEAANRYSEVRGVAPRDQLERTALAQQEFDLFTDDTPLACGVEDPESCEACQ
jgi:hypothetical protein